MRNSETNSVIVTGKMCCPFAFNHEMVGEKFYVAEIEVPRLSGETDVLPIMVSERLLDVNQDYTGMMVRIQGQFRSCNINNNERTRLVLNVFVRNFEVLEEAVEPKAEKYNNQITLDGYICKPPICRKTPKGRMIADVLMAVNRPYGKSDYIPCIFWGRNASFMECQKVGTRLQVKGRIQSRIYRKKIGEDQYEERVAYEVSVSSFKVIEEMTTSPDSTNSEGIAAEQSPVTPEAPGEDCKNVIADLDVPDQDVA